MKKLTLPATVSVKELAERLSVSGPELIKYLMGNGVMATLNQSVDYDTAALAADVATASRAPPVIFTIAAAPAAIASTTGRPKPS